ncbi:MAG: hypothetical protein LKI42_01860 [Bacteroidales bacterium]|jgi:tetratricopeptide (TPR) repeat protein|nr:hypothetical protein [Bacteroidales bacterium]MCI1785439.1 hypothetical protein [Bacteroidales bacterium]
MKKILLAFAVFASLQIANAQVKSLSAAKQAVDAAESVVQKPKKAAKASSWLKLGEAYIKAYDAPTSDVWQGATKQQLQLLLASEKPSSSDTVTVNGSLMTKEVFSDKNLYFNQNNQLAIIEVTKPVIADALDKASEAYLKAYSIDSKKKKVVLEAVQNIAKKYVSEAYNAYSLGDLKSANLFFGKAVDISAKEPLAVLDTNSLYNQGFTAWSLGDNAQAKECFDKCIAANYYGDKGEVYAKLGDVEAKLGDKTASRDYLEKGFEKFPQSQSILIGLINYYVTSGENTDKLFALLDKAKKNEPNNASLYYVEGNIHNKLGEEDKAIEAYGKCAEINPDYEFGYIGVGTLYYNKALAIQDKAQAELDDAKYEALVKQFETSLKDAIEPFEKAYSITKDDKVKLGIAEYLKNAYYRFRDEDPKYKAGYDKYSKIVSTGKPE